MDLRGHGLQPAMDVQKVRVVPTPQRMAGERSTRRIRRRLHRAEGRDGTSDLRGGEGGAELHEGRGRSQVSRCVCVQEVS